MGPRLQCTKDYCKFEVHEFNRDIGRTAKLERLMKEQGFIPAYPLHCVRNGNGKLKIKAGHHRFYVAQKLGLPVWFIVCDDTVSIPELEGGTNPWRFKDFVQSYVRTGSPHHEAIVSFSSRTGIGLMQSASLLAGEGAASGNQGERVKDGSYVVKDTTHAEAVGAVIVRCRDMKIPFATATNFISAVSSMVRVPEFDAEVFLHRAETNPQLLRKQSTLAQYQELIDAIYNHKAQYKLPLAFMARDVAKRRSAIGRNNKVV